MAAFQKSKDRTEQEVILKLMTGVERDPHISQRKLAFELGIAVGLVNAYLKRCVVKGWIKATQVPAKRLAYYLTPAGFLEKSKLVADYLSDSLTFLRNVREQSSQQLLLCQQQGFKRLAIVGDGEIVQTVSLVAGSMSIDVACVDKEAVTPEHFDAALIADISDPQGTYDWVCKTLPVNCVFVLPLLHVSTYQHHKEAS